MKTCKKKKKEEFERKKRKINQEMKFGKTKKGIRKI